MPAFFLIQGWAGGGAGFRTRRTAPNRTAAEQQALDLCDCTEYGATAYRPTDVRIVTVEAATIADALEIGDRGYGTELTETGEQFVIPGCERRPGAGRQLELFA